MFNLRSRIRDLVNKRWTAYLERHSYVHKDAFTRPYIIRKNVEGVQFLFAIRDAHARLWYDLYCTDPIWIEMRFIRDHLVRPGDIVMECGSHHGCTAILLANWVGPKGAVYAYEPGLRNFEVLKENISLNNLSNVHPINAAVGGSRDVVRFIEFLDNSMGSKVASGSAGPGRTSETYEVEQVLLDDSASLRPALIKIDTQGYVYQPLLGCRKIIEEQKPHLALEIDGKEDIEQYGANFDRILPIIHHEEYDYFAQFEEGEEPVPIPFSEILPQWNRRNGLMKNIHLYAKNRARARAPQTP